jgi:hypothetical protein
MTHSGATHGIISDQEPNNDCQSGITWLCLRVAVKLTVWPKASTRLRFLARVLLFRELHQVPSPESRSPEGECHLLKCQNVFVQNYGVISQHNYSHDKFKYRVCSNFFMAFSYILLWWKPRLQMLSMEVILEWKIKTNWTIYTPPRRCHYFYVGRGGACVVKWSWELSRL